MPDCKDGFDEKNCSLLILDTELYRKEMPPMGMDGENSEIFVNMSILNFVTIDEIEQSFQLKFFLQLWW